MTKNSPDVSDAELDVLKVLWQHGPATVRDVNAQLRRKKHRWAYNTVLTLLSRLRDKRYVASEKEGVAHVFRAVVSRKKLLRRRLTDLADRVCDGTTSPLVQALVDARKFSADDVAQLRALVEELEKQED